MKARELLVDVELLDHQIVYTDGHLAGKVDDLDIEIGPDGTAIIVALVSGPGVLADRVGWHRYGRWRQRVERFLEPGRLGTSRIPWRDVREIANAVRINLHQDETASFGSERWVRDNLIGHIPGARHAS